MLKDRILAALRRAYDEAGTQQGLQKKTGVTHAQISRLLSGRNSCGQMRIETLEKLFPDLEISFFRDERVGLVAAPDVLTRRVAQQMAGLDEDARAECLEAVATIAALRKPPKKAAVPSTKEDGHDEAAVG